MISNTFKLKTNFYKISHSYGFCYNLIINTRNTCKYQIIQYIKYIWQKLELCFIGNENIEPILWFSYEILRFEVNVVNSPNFLRFLLKGLESHRRVILLITASGPFIRYYVRDPKCPHCLTLKYNVYKLFYQVLLSLRKELLSAQL